MTTNNKRDRDQQPTPSNDNPAHGRRIKVKVSDLKAGGADAFEALQRRLEAECGKDERPVLEVMEITTPFQLGGRHLKVPEVGALRSKLRLGIAPPWDGQPAALHLAVTAEEVLSVADITEESCKLEINGNGAGIDLTHESVRELAKSFEQFGRSEALAGASRPVQRLLIGCWWITGRLGTFNAGILVGASLAVATVAVSRYLL